MAFVPYWLTWYRDDRALGHTAPRPRSPCSSGFGGTRGDRERVVVRDVTVDSAPLVVRRKQLKGRHERQRDRLLGLVAGPDSGSHRRAGNHPGKARARGSRRASRVRADRPSACRSHMCALLEARKASPCGEQRLLQRVPGVVRRAEDSIAVNLQLTAIGPEELAETLPHAQPGRVPAARRSPWPSSHHLFHVGWHAAAKQTDPPGVGNWASGSPRMDGASWSADAEGTPARRRGRASASGERAAPARAAERVRAGRPRRPAE